MQLTEIKNDLATINYSPELNRLLLSDFILIEDSNQSILAQVISIEATMEDDVNSAMLKFILSIDKNANLTQYTGYVPAKNASLILINPQEVVQLIRGNDKNIEMGKLAAYPDIPVEVSLDFLRKKTYIQVDFFENKLQIVESIIKGLEKHNKKTILFDFSGLYSRISLPTVTLGYNFKLPLNYEALCHIANEELNDCNNDNKAFIQGILIEIQNYVKSLPEKFIPFDTLISVMDSQYEETHIPELLLLKNKLVKYQQLGVFAQDKSEFDFLNTFLKDAKNFKFDLSELPAQWQKVAFLSILDNIKAKYYLIADFTDDNSNKSVIKKVYEKSEIKPIVLSSYNYKYQLQLKALSKNLVLFKPIHKVNDFAGYTSFLNILSQDTFIIWGDQTLFIPLILKTGNFGKSEFFKEAIIKPIENIDNTDYENYTENEIENIEPDNLIDVDPVPIYEEPTDTIDEKTDKNIEVINNQEENTNDSIDYEDIEYVPEEEVVEEAEEEAVKEAEEEVVKNIESNEFDNQNFIKEEEEEENTYTDIIDNENDAPNTDDLDFFFNEDLNEKDITEESQITSLPETEHEVENEPETINNIEEPITNIIEENSFQTEIQNEENTDIEINSEETDSLEDIVLDDNLQDISTVPNTDDIEDITTVSQEETEEAFDNDNIELAEPNILSIDEIEDIVEPETELEEEADNDNVENAEENTNKESMNDTVVETLEEENLIHSEENSINIEQQVTDNKKNTEQKIIIPEPKGIEIKKPSIPIYTSNVAPQFNTKYAQGTYVYHQKYGRGVIEKVTHSGNKELCMIVFDKYGRKLLDPSINDLKQI